MVEKKKLKSSEISEVGKVAFFNISLFKNCLLKRRVSVVYKIQDDQPVYLPCCDKSLFCVNISG